MKTLQMVFVNEAGSNVTISLPEPKEDITSQEVADLMALIISKNAFLSNGGSLVSAAAARLVSRDVETIIG